MNADVREILHGASIALIFQIIGVGFSFGVNIVLAHSLGIEGTGIYYLAANICSIGIICGGMGLENTLLRYTANNAALYDWNAVKGAYFKGIRLALCSSIFFAGMIFLLSPYISKFIFYKPELTDPLRLMSISVIPVVLVILHAGMLKGLKRIAEANFIYGLGIPLLSLIGIPVLAYFWSVNGAVLAYFIAAVSMTITGVYMWKKSTPNLKEYKGYFSTRKLINTGTPMLAVQLINLIISSSSTYIIGIWLSNSEVGLFNIANKTAMLISFPLIAVSQIAAPKFAAVHDNDMSALQQLARYSVNITTIAGGGIFLLFAFFSDTVMGIFGAEFSKGNQIFLILSIAQLVNAVTGPVGFLLIMRGYERIRFNIMLISAVFSLFFNLIFIRYYGTIGAALSFTIITSLTNISYVFVIRYYLKIWVFPDILSKLFKHLLRP